MRSNLEPRVGKSSWSNLVLRVDQNIEYPAAQVAEGLRYVGRLPSQQVGDYTELDLSISRHLSQSLEVSLVGQNLLSSHHAEFGRGGGRVEVQRSLYGKLVVRW